MAASDLVRTALRSRAVQGALAFGAGATGLVAADLTVLAGGIVRAAAAFPPPIDDGPDPALDNPAHLTRSSVVATDDGTLLHVESSLNIDDHPGDDVLVLIHGWTCSTRFWNPQFNRFAADRPMIAYDQRGHGLSEMGRTKVTPATLGQDLQRVLSETVPEGKRAILVGHSMGGMSIMSWAQQFGGRMAERVSQVVLVSTTPRKVVQEQLLTPTSLAGVADPVKPIMGRIFLGTPVPLPSNKFSSRMTHYLALAPKARAAHVDFCDEMIARCSPRSRAAWGSAMYGMNLVGGLEALSVPTTVLVGTDDLLTPPLHSDFMAGVLDRNGVLRDYITYPDTGHMLPIERHEDLNAVIAGVLA
ncbi:MAG: alpha/beta fold hydrolase [Gordonia sp. (in: high G+C Gram-positive bacteria)]|uniref:alpha/beta fold hydrolase n=1 Tax=Gordonia sp. (in: high G+C Gram-positive bacteria) TaxID=84139 RepID=UPI0039E6AC79